MAAIQRLQLLAGLIERLEKEDVARRDERESGGRSAGMQQKDAAGGALRPCGHGHLLVGLMVAFADGDVGHIRVREDKIDVPHGRSVLREDHGFEGDTALVDPQALEVAQ